jgi:hypothetical protein
MPIIGLVLARRVNGQRHDDYVIQVTKHGDEIGNEVDRRQGGPGHAKCQRFNVPGHSWVASGEIDGDYVALDLSRPIFEAITHNRRDTLRWSPSAPQRLAEHVFQSPRRDRVHLTAALGTAESC